MKITYVRLWCCVATLTVAAWLRPAGAAEETNRYSGPVWSLLDPKAELAAAAGITPEKYPDCDDATVDCRSVRVYRADGTGEAQDENLYQGAHGKGQAQQPAP